MGLRLVHGSSSSLEEKPKRKTSWSAFSRPSCSCSDHSGGSYYKPVSADECLQFPFPKLPNPDPNNYKIVKSKKVGDFLVLMVYYPDCTNYEGRKILVFEKVTLEQLQQQNAIDPHFCDNPKFHSPIARFEPTKRGWRMALRLCSEESK